jgi:hypothetical protein
MALAIITVDATYLLLKDGSIVMASPSRSYPILMVVGLPNAQVLPIQ